MSGGSPTNGVVDNYDNMTPIPVISYNQTNNTLVINNPVQSPQVAQIQTQLNQHGTDIAINRFDITLI